MHDQMRKDAFAERIVRGNLSFLSKIKVASSPAPYYYYEKCSGEGSTRLQRERLAVAPYAIFLKSKRRSDPFAGSEGAGGGQRDFVPRERPGKQQPRSPQRPRGHSHTQGLGPSLPHLGPKKADPCRWGHHGCRFGDICARPIPK